MKLSQGADYLSGHFATKSTLLSLILVYSRNSSECCVNDSIQKSYVLVFFFCQSEVYKALKKLINEKQICNYSLRKKFNYRRETWSDQVMIGYSRRLFY